ncbi:unnamed protein product [Brassica oleracea var. botrytis]
MQKLGVRNFSCAYTLYLLCSVHGTTKNIYNRHGLGSFISLSLSVNIDKVNTVW